jgi:hypothetical protein
VPLTAILAGIYVASAGLFRSIFTRTTGAGSDAAIAIATLAAYTLLTPIKNQLQALVDRRFREGRPRGAVLSDLLAQGRAVGEVLNVPSFATTLLSALCATLPLRGALLLVESPHRAWSVEAGTNGEAGSFVVPVCYESLRVGELRVWPQDELSVPDAATGVLLDRAANVLATLIVLTPAGAPLRKPVAESRD